MRRPLTSPLTSTTCLHEAHSRQNSSDRRLDNLHPGTAARARSFVDFVRPTDVASANGGRRSSRSRQDRHLSHIKTDIWSYETKLRPVCRSLIPFRNRPNFFRDRVLGNRLHRSALKRAGRAAQGDPARPPFYFCVGKPRAGLKYLNKTISGVLPDSGNAVPSDRA
jgi:hypothetical protein